MSIPHLEAQLLLDLQQVPFLLPFYLAVTMLTKLASSS